MKREDTRVFLEGLRAHLNAAISLTDVQPWLADIKEGYEGLFVDKFVLPQVSEYLRSELSPSDACKALLAESTLARARGIASESPASNQKHLFGKRMGLRVDRVVDVWWSASPKLPVTQSCPDWALRQPSEHKVVFEGKLFRSGGVAAAKSELVKWIYECAYYRAQPRMEAVGKKPGWDYDYACLVAYDASPKHSLIDAWSGLRRMHSEFWNAANIFVMVLPSG